MDFLEGMTVSPKKMGIKIEPQHFRKRKTYYTSPGHLRSTTAWMKNFPALKSAYQIYTIAPHPWWIYVWIDLKYKNGHLLLRSIALLAFYIHMVQNEVTRQKNSAAGIEGGNPLSPVQVITAPCTTASAVPHPQYNAILLNQQGALYELCKAHSEKLLCVHGYLYTCVRSFCLGGRSSRGDRLALSPLGGSC